MAGYTPQRKEIMRRRGAKFTANRRALAEKIKKKIKTEGRDPMPEDPPLVDASNLPLGNPNHTPKGYRPEYANFAREMARLGATDIEIARGLNISMSTMWGWQSRHEDFFTAFLEGKDYCDDRVERALYNRAVGYSYPEVQISVHQGVPVVVPYIKHIPPDSGAATRWLRSRRRDKWAEKTEVTLGGDEQFTQVWQAIAQGQVHAMLPGGELEPSKEPADDSEEGSS